MLKVFQQQQQLCILDTLTMLVLHTTHSDSAHAPDKLMHVNNEEEEEEGQSINCVCVCTTNAILSQQCGRI